MVTPNGPVYPSISSPATTSIQNVPQTVAPQGDASAFDKAFAGAQSVTLPSLKYTNPALESPLDPTLRYDDPVYGYSALNPNTEAQYADRQSWLGSFKNNLLKFGANTLGTIGTTFASIPYAIQAIGEGKLSDIYNNPVVNGINDWTEGLENTLPSYAGQYEQNHPVLSAINPFKWGAFANTWGSVIKNLGFVAGDIASAAIVDTGVGLVTGGAGDVPFAAVQTEKIATDLGKFAKIAAGSPEVVNSFNEALQAGEDIKSAVDKLATSAKIGNGIKYGLNIFASTIGQSALIANNTYRSSKEQLEGDYVNKYGVLPSGDQAKNIEELAVGAGNTNLIANAAIMSVGHAYSLKSFFSPTAQALRDGVEQEIALGVKLKINPENIDEIQNVTQTVKGFKGVINNSLPLLKNIGVQGLQGGALYFTDNAVKSYIQRKYDDNNIDSFDNLWQSLGDGFANTLLSKEGQQSILLGGLTGALIHGGSALFERIKGVNNNKQDVANLVLSNLNQQGVTGLFQHTYDEGLNAASISKDMETAAKNNDPFNYKNLQLQSLFNFVSGATKAGRFDLRIDQLNSLKDLNQQQFETLFQLKYTDENRRIASEYVDSLKNKAFDVKKTIEKVNDAFPNTYNIKKQSLDYNVYDNYKDALALTLSHISDNKNRIRDLGSDISKLFPSIDTSKIVNLTTTQGIDQTIKSFQDRIKELNTSKTLLTGTEAEDLKNGHDKEISFLNDKIKFLSKHKDYVESKINNPETNDTHEQTSHADRFVNEASEILDYYKDNNLKGTTTDFLSTIEALNKGGDVNRLADFSRSATDYYNILSTKKGYNDFHDYVAALIQGKQSRIEIGADGKFTYVTPEVIKQREDNAKAQDIATKKQQFEDAHNAQTPPEATTDEQKKALETIIEKEKTKQPLTDEEKVLKEEKKQAYTNKKKAAQKAEEDYDNLTFEDQQAVDEIKDKDAKLAEIEKRRQEALKNNGKPITLPKELSGARPTYNFGDKKYTLTFDSDLDKAAYILAQKTPSKRDADYLNFVMDATGMTEKEARAYGQKIKDQIKEEAKNGNGGNIKVPSSGLDKAKTPEEINKQFDSEVKTVEIPTPVVQQQQQAIKVQEAKPISQKQYTNVTPDYLFHQTYSINYGVDGPQRGRNLFERLFKKIFPEKISNELQIKVSPSTKGLEVGSFTKEPVIPGTKLYRGGNDIDIIVSAEGKEIGQLQDNLFFDRDGKKLPILELKKSEYKDVTGNSEDTYDSFIKEAQDHQRLIDQLKSKTDLSNKDLQDIIGRIAINYGVADYVNTPQEATLIKSARYQPKDSYILSLPIVKDEVTGQSSRQLKNIIGYKGVINDLPEDVKQFFNDNIDQITGLNRRYVALYRMPDGSFSKASIIAARPAVRNAESLESLLSAIKSGKVDDIQRELDNVYIADSSNKAGYGTKIGLKHLGDGNFSLDIENKNKKVSIKIPISKAELEKIKSVSGFTELLTKKVLAERADTPRFKTLNITEISERDFKSNVLKDEKTTFGDLKDKLTLSTNPDVFKGYSLSIRPKEDLSAQQPKVVEIGLAHKIEVTEIKNPEQESTIEDNKQALLESGKSEEDINKLSPTEVKEQAAKLPVDLTNKPLNKDKILTVLKREYKKFYGKDMNPVQIKKFESKLVQFSPTGHLDSSYIQSIFSHGDESTSEGSYKANHLTTDSGKQLSANIGVIKGDSEFYKLREQTGDNSKKPLSNNELKNNFDILREIKNTQKRLDRTDDPEKVQEHDKRIAELESKLDKNSEEYKRAKNIFDNFDSITRELEKDGNLKIDCK